MAQSIPSVPIPSWHLSGICHLVLKMLQMPHGGDGLFIQNPHGGGTAPKMIPTPKSSPTLKLFPNRPRNDPHFSSRRPRNDPQLILGME